jgi:hypothetical protein
MLVWHGGSPWSHLFENFNRCNQENTPGFGCCYLSDLETRHLL